MNMATFASYFHEETCSTVKPPDTIGFIGQSLPYFNRVRAEIRNRLQGKELPLVKRAFDDFLPVHDSDYLFAIKQLSNDRPVDIPDWNAECTSLYYALPGYEYGLGGVCNAIDLMKQGVLDRAYCFSLPSHHAFPDKGHGYCILNTEAAAVRYAQSLGFEKILVIDWDIHHGDGTQTIFENDASVYCMSIHSAVDLYMSQVGSIELGTTTYGTAVGHCNIPVLSHHFSEAFYNSELQLPGTTVRGHQSITVSAEALHNLPWNPDMIVVFDGHDSHKDDCGSDTTKWDYLDFARLTDLVVNLAKKQHCPVLSMPGGGYDLRVTIETALVHIEGLQK